MSEVYPVKFEPIYKEKIWGGRNLQRLFGRQLPGGPEFLIGESWELADLQQGVSIAANGPEAGATLTDLTRRWGDELLGGARCEADGRFPLLLKFLDANDILSLQVHPDARAVEEIGPQAALKTECWYIVESRGGKIYKGAKSGITAGEFRKAIETDTVENVVRQIDVAGGDFHYLPAGTVHAIGAGLVIAEVQTPSDTTYRVTDWGRGREIHVASSMQCIRFDLPADQQPGAEGETLLVTEYFTVARHAAAADQEISPPQGRCLAVMILAGKVTISHDGTVEPIVEAGAGDTVLVPAGLSRLSFNPHQGVTYLEITLPERA